MAKDIPISDKIKVVNVHKIKDFATCQRKYYWRHIRNLDGIWMNRAYWYGSRAGAGAETLLKGRAWSTAQKAMAAEDRRFFDRYKVRENDKEPIEIERRLINIFLRGFQKSPEFQDLHIDGRQQTFRVKLRDSGLWFVGTEDGNGTVGDRDALFELKNLKMISANLLADLLVDLQINGYTYGRRLAKEPYASLCMYMIFRKTSKWIKRRQSVDDFVAEIEQDVQDRPEFYYVFKKFRLNRVQVDEVGHDIESMALDLVCKYQRLGADVVDPCHWGRSDACSNFAGCSYRKLCQEPSKRNVWLRDFQMRELRYDDEHEELA